MKAADDARRGTHHGTVLEAWLAQPMSVNTRAAYRRDVELFIRWCDEAGERPLHADTSTLATFQAEREEAGDSPATLRRRWSALASYFQSAVAQGARESNPVEGAARPRAGDDDPSPTAVLDQRDVERYRAAAREIDPRLEALIVLIAFEGLKLGEVLALDIDHVAGRPPRMSLTVPGRDERERLHLTPDSAAVVHRVVASRRRGPLLTSARASAPRTGAGRLTRFGADHLIRQLSGDGGARVTANALRRFHGIATRDAGRDLEEIRERMGLADVRSVRRHLRARSEP